MAITVRVHRGTKVRTHGFDANRFGPNPIEKSHLHPVPLPGLILPKLFRVARYCSGTVAEADAAAAAHWQALSPSPRPNRQATVTRAQHQTQAVILTAREGAAGRYRIRVTEFEPILWYSILVRGTVPGQTTAAAAVAVVEVSTASSNWHCSSLCRLCFGVQGRL